jgi:hypothetical protein
VRILGVLMFLAGGGGTAFSTWAIFTQGRPRDVAFAVAAPLALLVALIGLLLAFVPDFFA